MGDPAGFLAAVRDWLNEHTDVGSTRYVSGPAVEVLAVRGGEGYDRGSTEEGFWNADATHIVYRTEDGTSTRVVEDEEEFTSLWNHLMAAWPN